MKRKRVVAYKAYALHANGTRRRLDAHGVVVELRPGIEVEIDFAPHPNLAGQLVMVTPPCPRMRRVYEEGLIDDFAVVFGASNVLHILVERRRRSKKRPRADRRAP